MHCSEFNLTEPVGDCDAGYYCPSAADSPTFILCTEGHYCESGSAQPTPCPQGKDKLLSYCLYMLFIYHILNVIKIATVCFINGSIR